MFPLKSFLKLEAQWVNSPTKYGLVFTLTEKSSLLISKAIFGNCTTTWSEFNQKQIQQWSIAFGTAWGKLAIKWKGLGISYNWYISYTAAFQYKLNLLIQKIIWYSCTPPQHYLARAFAFPGKQITFFLSMNIF